MNELTIQDAKDLSYKYRKRGVIIIHFSQDQFGVASYGITRKDCDNMKKVSDQIFDRITNGEITL